MNNPTDLINSIFQYLAGLMIFRNCIMLYKHKDIKGISKISTCFFAIWGFWNLYFYPANGFSWSFISSCFIVICNTFWLLQMIYYTNKKIQKDFINEQ